MRLSEYYQLPANLLNVPQNTWDAIREEADKNDGNVLLYFPTRVMYYVKGIQRWQTVWQLIDYNIYTDTIAKLFPYRKVDKAHKKTMPIPHKKDVGDRFFFNPEYLPRPLINMLREKVYYYKLKAKQI